MNQREKKLALAVGAAVLLWAANIGWAKYQSALKANQNKQTQVAQDLSEAKTASLRGKRAQTRLRKWSQQSLPTDPDLARSLYQDWLRQKLTAAGLAVKSLDVSSPRSGSRSYQQFTFTVNAAGKIEQLTAFLYEFYEAKHLHRLSQTTLLPMDKSGQLNITLKVDALALPNGDRADQLAEGEVETFDVALEDYVQQIGSRSPFASYQPPQVEEPQVVVETTNPVDNAATRAIFSGIHYGDSGWLLLIRMEDSGKLRYFREGDEIHVGQFHGTVEQLDGSRRRAIISQEEGRVELRFGKTLAQALPLDDPAS